MTRILGTFDPDGFDKSMQERLAVKTLGVEVNPGKSWEGVPVIYEGNMSKQKIGVRPLGNRIVVRRDESKTVSDGGIALPDQSVEVPKVGTALAVGPGAWRYGNLDPCTVRPGDRVMFSSYAGNVAVIGGEELLVMCEDDILCVLDE